MLKGWVRTHGKKHFRPKTHTKKSFQNKFFETPIPPSKTGPFPSILEKTHHTGYNYNYYYYIIYLFMLFYYVWCGFAAIILFVTKVVTNGFSPAEKA